ncbi:MAG: lipid-A-disaccharide synthase [Deltaproteobacteria bacterium RIFOXYD12_FULL_57_12]|nr:MAG: lipid-A-disaccharide synthase [Deltaproteobacteria bacterium RIFOXYD12_FULL_57_12]
MKTNGITTGNGIMIVAGEASGDLHGAGLARAFGRLAPGLPVCGMGGVEMATSDVEILVDIDGLAVMGLVEVIGRLATIRAAMRTLVRRLRERPPELLILIDYPGFNLLLAEKAKKLGVPILYYISPKVWAWREGRIKKIKRFVDRLAVILPFEEAYFKRHGLAVDFVGNPLLDSVRPCTSRAEFLEKQAIEPGRTVVGLLPGSRRQEIARLLPLFIEAAERLAPELAAPVFLLPLATTLSRADLAAHGLAATSLDIRVCGEDRYGLMAACDAVLAASGTVTLELAILGVPMVVSYRVALLSYLLASPFIKVQYASLVNLVADRPVVPEFLQYDATPAALAAALKPLLLDEEAQQAMRQELAAVCRQLGTPGAAECCARIALEMLGRRD